MDKKESCLIEIFGEENLQRYLSQKFIIDTKKEKLEELIELRQKASEAFNVHLSCPDIAVAASSGILLGILNAIFKDHVPKHGLLRHEHSNTRTAIDYQVPKPQGFNGSVQGLHRQIGPGHDVFRFKEALQLMKGESTDFNLWGKTATKILGHELKPGGESLEKFRQLGGFKFPENPKAELINHLLIDFFTRRSLPIPGSSYIADHSPEMAKTMLSMYEDGLNLKTASGNFIGFIMVQIIIHGYTFLFKAITDSNFSFPLNIEKIKNLHSSYLKLITKNEFHVMMMMSHGASFLFDSIITMGSKSYAGLLQLNYLSLLVFSKHLMQYLLKNMKEYSKLIEQAKEKAWEISDFDAEWIKNYKTNLQKHFGDPSFISIFDRDEWSNLAIKVDNFRENIHQGTIQEKSLVLELEGLADED